MAFINKESIIEFITKGLNNPDNEKAYGYDAIEILSEIQFAPSVDFVYCIECEFCKELKTDNTIYCDRTFAKTDVDPTGFCSYGRRRQKS